MPHGQPASPAVAQSLQQAGHDAVHVRDYGLQAASDEAVLERAALEGRILVSADSDFGALAMSRQSMAPSIMLFRRSSRRAPEQQVALLLANPPSVTRELEQGAIVVLEEGRIRVRALRVGGEIKKQP
ncbi:MAG: DUF5615 family PIN-like protein [Alphaproteobacteria bacterium]